MLIFSLFYIFTLDNNFLNISLNSTYEIINISYKLTNNELTGKVMQYYDIIASLNKLEVKTNEWANGVYFYTLYDDKQQLETKKIVIMK